MLKLITLEQRQRKFTPYVIASIFIVTIMFYTLITGIDMDTAGSSANRTIIPSLDMTSSYLGTNSVLCFSLMGTVIFSRLVITEYSGKHPVLLFSYPVSRIKVFLAKFLLAAGFTLLAVLVSSLLVGLFLMFFEPTSSQLLYDFGLIELGRHMIISLTAGLISVSLATVGLLIGFLMKSVPATIITAVVIVLFTSNPINGLLGEGILVLLSLIVVSLLITIAVAALLANYIRRMEV